MKESAQSDFIPLPEAKSDQINISLPLPNFVDPYNIGINLKAINRLARHSGLRTLSIVGSTDEETSQVTPMLAGFNQHGEAYAAKASTKTTVPEYNTDFRYDAYQSLLPKFARWADANVDINMAEVSQKIQNNPNYNVRDPQAWAHELNRIMQESVFTIGNKHLMQGNPMREDAVYWAMTAIIGTQIYAASMTPEGLAAGLIFGPVFGTFGQHIFDRFRYIHTKTSLGIASEGYRNSIYATRPHDLDGALAVMASATTLVKDISKQSN
jgi:hypothetical protein